MWIVLLVYILLVMANPEYLGFDWIHIRIMNNTSSSEYNPDDEKSDLENSLLHSIKEVTIVLKKVSIWI